MDILSIQQGGIGGKSVSTGVNVAATTVALTLTENAATITIDRNVLAGTDALVLSTYAATASVGGNVNVSAGTALLVLATYSATVEGASEEAEEPVATAGGWGGELWYYEALRQMEEARKREEEAAQVAQEARRQEQEAQEALVAAGIRKAQLADARARLAAIREARRAAEADVELARFHVERLRQLEAKAHAEAEAAEEEEAVALCLMMLMS